MKVAFTLNGRPAAWDGPPLTRLAAALRDDLGLTGTKVGCDAGDCGACTVRLDGHQVCSCLVAMGQVGGRAVDTVEGLANQGLSSLQRSFLLHGAAQCGICTPGMLMAAQDLLAGKSRPSRSEVEDALGGVLCRCTGYSKIVDAVMDAASTAELPTVEAGAAVGARLARVDGMAKVTGTDRFGADAVPPDALWIRVIRSPHARARFTVGDLGALRRRLTAVLTAADVPFNGFGIYPDIKDQPVLADGLVRYRGEAVLALVGGRQEVLAIRDQDLPIDWVPESPLLGVDAATAPGAPLVQADKPRNMLLKGGVLSGDPSKAFAACAAVAEGTFETAFVEHGYIEPEAGWARRVGDRIEIHASTQTPYMDRDEVASVAVFLASDQSSYITGDRICCAGGAVMSSIVLMDCGVPRAMTLMSARTWRAIIPRRLLLPTPLPPKIPTLCPRPQVMNPSMARMPQPIGSRIGCRASGSGKLAPHF